MISHWANPRDRTWSLNIFFTKWLGSNGSNIPLFLSYSHLNHILNRFFLFDPTRHHKWHLSSVTRLFPCWSPSAIYWLLCFSNKDMSYCQTLIISVSNRFWWFDVLFTKWLGSNIPLSSSYSHFHHLYLFYLTHLVNDICHPSLVCFLIGLLALSIGCSGSWMTIRQNCQMSIISVTTLSSFFGSRCRK